MDFQVRGEGDTHRANRARDAPSTYALRRKAKGRGETGQTLNQAFGVIDMLPQGRQGK